jgi:hypothetical protein
MVSQRIDTNPKAYGLDKSARRSDGNQNNVRSVMFAPRIDAVKFCPQKTWREGVCVSNSPQVKLLGFPWIPLAESGLFNGLQRIQIKNLSALSLPEKRPCPRARMISDNLDSITKIPFQTKHCFDSICFERLPLVAQERQELESANRRRRTQTFASGKLGHATARAMKLRTIGDVSPRR